jgi:hypothetical protein
MAEYNGPTVTEYAEMRIRQINDLIADLEDERRMLRSRADRYYGLKMLESERVATAAEPFQEKQL